MAAESCSTKGWTAAWQLLQSGDCCIAVAAEQRLLHGSYRRCSTPIVPGLVTGRGMAAESCSTKGWTAVWQLLQSGDCCIAVAAEQRLLHGSHCSAATAA